MDTPPRKPVWIREELLHLLSLSGTLAGLCITGVALFHTLGKTAASATIADDILAIAALMFLVCIYVIVFALRVKREAVARSLEKVVDALFLLALTAMVTSGFIMVYTAM